MSHCSFATVIVVICGFRVLLGAIDAQSEEVCAGDCDGNLAVTVDELVLGVRIDLGELGIDACQTLDRNGDERVTIDEVGVDSANQVIESDESNNRQRYPLAFPTAPPFCTVTPTPSADI